tara:strand:- start:9684 stop:9860 length:177 start_codon:yes stop_codon:yes gene_type:complete
MGELLVVASKVKDIVKGAGCNTGGGFVDALSKSVEDMVNRAVERAKGNGRKTVQAKDA